MKRFLILPMLLCGSIFAAVGQQALGSRAPMVSPALNDDGTVTFIIPRADSDSAVSVIGDCIPGGQAGMTAGVTDAGRPVWRYTTPAAVAPELYTYHYDIDGHATLDPSNVAAVRDIATLNNLLLLPGTEADTAHLYINRRGVPHGTVEQRWIDLEERSRRITVYTPAGYAADGERRYPVLYLLHGMGGDEMAWLDLGRAAQILDNLIAEGKAQPMIVVMPNGNIAMDAAPGVYPPEPSRARAGQVMQQPVFNLPRTMDGGYEASFGDIVAAVDTLYRTEADYDHRAIAGLSMGGFHSALISRQYPDMFGWIGLFSAATDRMGRPGSPVYADGEAKFARQFERRPHLYYIAIGREDFLYDANTEMRSRFDAAGYPYLYNESGGGHQWSNWRRYLVDFVPRLFR